MISRKLLTKMIVAFGVGGVFGWLTWSLLPENKQRSLGILGSHAHLLLAVFNCLFVSALILSISFAYSRPDKTENTFDKRIAQFFFESESDNNRLKLNPHIGVFLFVAVSALYIPVFLLWAFGFLSVPLSTSIEIWMKILLPIVGGIGGVFYLVLKYREQQNDERKLIFDEEESRREQTNFERDIKLKEKEVENALIRNEAEKNRADEREKQETLVNAIRLLESESAHVRVAGVYALAKVSDRYPEDHKQTVVDILCGYLRTDRTDRIVDDKFKDAAVESAIIKVIGEHLRKDRADLGEKVQTFADEQLWCDCSFDFRGVRFMEPVTWDKTLWNKAVDFSDSTSINKVYFSSAYFFGECRFDRVSFADSVGFDGARFLQEAWFGDAKFAQDVWFGSACFTREVRFSGVRFAGYVGFGGAHFDGYAGFRGARFISNSWFRGARFAGDAWFDGASFIGDVWFDEARFTGSAWFGGVNFASHVGFRDAIFNSNAEFIRASFIEPFDFKLSIFKEKLVLKAALLCNREVRRNIHETWKSQNINNEWTPARKIERLTRVYKHFYEALQDHQEKAKKLAGIQKTISENFPDVTLDFKALETEAEKEI